MVFTDLQLEQYVATYFWPFFRIGALFVAAPILNVKQIPVRFRIMLAVMITWLVVPLLPAPPRIEIFEASTALMIAQELAVGLAMGFLVQMAFNALIFGGQVMAFSMGLGFANMMDPTNGVQVPVVSQYYLILAMLAFLMMNGHLVLIQMIVDSFTVLPAAAGGLSRNGVWELVLWGGRMFASGLVMALPVIMALLLINIGLGMIGRAAPQLNIFVVGFPITLTMGFVLMWATMPHVMTDFGALVIQAMQDAVRILTVR